MLFEIVCLIPVPTLIPPFLPFSLLQSCQYVRHYVCCHICGLIIIISGIICNNRSVRTNNNYNNNSNSSDGNSTQ